MKKVHLSEVTVNLDSKRKPLNNVERNGMKSNPKYPYYGTNGQMDLIDDYIFDEEIICIAEDGGNWSKGSVCSYIVNGKCWVNNHAHVLRTKKGLNIKYLMYYLNNADLTQSITGTTRGKLTKSALNEIEIPLPPLETQKKIVEVLDKVQALIDARKEQIRLMDDLIQSVFYEMFGDYGKYPKKSIDEVCQGIYDCPHSTPKYSDRKTLYRCLRTSNLGNGYIDWSNLAYVDEKIYYERNKRYTPNIGDVVYSREGAILGISALVNEPKLMCLGQRLMVFSLNNKLIESTFFWMMLNSHFVRRQVELNIGGAAAPRINIKDIKKFAIFIPPINLQNAFGENIEIIETFKQKMSASRFDLENTYKSLLQKAFRGELFVG